jgi:hypothetical protein
MPQRFVQFGFLAGAVFFAVSLLGQQAPPGSKGLAKAKADYAKLKLNPVQPTAKEKLTGATQECVVETNAGTAIDMACSLPPGAKYYVDLEAKNGADAEGGFNWKACETHPNYMCPGANASWYGLGELPEEGGRVAIQARIVPFPGSVVRARMRITYQVP